MSLCAARTDNLAEIGIGKKMETKYNIGQRVYVNAGNLRKHGYKTAEVTIKRIMYVAICETGDEEIMSCEMEFEEQEIFETFEEAARNNK